jgi:hypothetical protein
MPDYYDRVEAQLARLTERGAHRRRRAWRPALPRVNAQVVGVAAAMLVVVAVGAAFLSAGTRQQLPRHLGAGANGPALIRNFSPAPTPAPSGLLVASTNLTPVEAGKSPTGKVRVYGKPPNRYEISITASGLKPNARGDAYAVWLLPVVHTPSGTYQPHGPELVGLISPSVGRDGKLAAEGLLPQDASGNSEILITLEPTGSTKTPGRAVLHGPIAF